MAAASEPKRQRVDGAVPMDVEDPLAEEIAALRRKIGRFEEEHPAMDSYRALLTTLTEMHELKAENNELKRQQARWQPGIQPDWNALQGAINANNTRLVQLQEQLPGLRTTARRLSNPASARGLSQQVELKRWPQEMWDEKTNLVTVRHLDKAGLGGVGDADRLLHMRQDAVDLFNSLEGLRTRGALVTGPPGTGKSSVAWLWACHQAQSRSVLWIHFGRDGRVFVVTWVNTGCSAYAHSFADGFNVASAVSPFQGSVVVLDGITEQLKHQLGPGAAWAARQVSTRRFVVVSSMQLRFGAEDLKVGNYQEIRIHSWSYEQYAEACRHAAFLLPGYSNISLVGDDLDVALADKYHVGGGSVRWMFGLSLDDAVKDANRWIRKAHNMQELLAGLHGSDSTVAVNHLVQETTRGFSLVSEYVSRAIAEKCELAFIREARHHAPDNGSFQGWVFEMAFLCRLRMCHTRGVGMHIGNETWSVRKRVYFGKIDELKGNIVMGMGPEICENVQGLGPGTWIIPKQFMQGGYDAVQLVAVDDPPQATRVMLRAVQVTRGQRHSLKLQYVVSLIRVLVAIGFEVPIVDVVFVVRTNGAATFSVGPIEGQLVQHLNPSGASWSHPASAHDYRVLEWGDADEWGSGR